MPLCGTGFCRRIALANLTKAAETSASGKAHPDFASLHPGYREILRSKGENAGLGLVQKRVKLWLVATAMLVAAGTGAGAQAPATSDDSRLQRCRQNPSDIH